MINLVNITETTKLIKPVTASDYLLGSGENFHPEGLFSEVIFGPKDSPERRSTFSFIELHCYILHPALKKSLQRLNRKILHAIYLEKSYKLDKDGFMVEDPEGNLKGITSIQKNFKKILEAREEDSKIRKDLKNMLLSYHNKNMVFINKCLVIPAFFRDAEVDIVHGGLRVNPINEYYVKIIRQAIQIESVSEDNIYVYDILSAKMQNLVDDLYDYIVKKISKKEGLIRGSILGKRADFTGGAVITGGADEIRVDEIGIPFKVLVKLFEPFIIYDIHNSGNVDEKKFSQLLKDYNNETFSVVSTRRLLSGIQKGFEIPEDLENLVKGSVLRAIEDKVVLAKRDPALHAESVQGFKPKMVDGETIKLNIAKCSAFNADFDGDRMAIYVPMTKESIQEARDKMISSESKDSIRLVSDDFNKDVVIGLYALTQDPITDKAPIVIRHDKELELLKPNIKIKYDGIITTPGRVLFNKILPSKKYYINEPIDKKKIKSLVSEIYNEYFESNKKKYVDFCDELIKIGMRYYTIMAPSFTLDDLTDIPKSIIKLKEELDKQTDINEANKIIDKMTEELQKHVESKNTNIGLIGKAGGLKNGYKQARQILISKGLITDPNGNLSVVKPSYVEGFNTREFFDSGFGSRKGIIDRVINTSDTGYLSRQLIFALQRVEADPNISDCRTKKYVTLKVTKDLANRLHGRYVVDEVRNIVPFDPKKHLNKVINLRSPLYCLTESICSTCYGDLLRRNRTKYVGILAAEVCGERLTQTIMRTFHVGGAASIKEVDILKKITNILDESEKRFVKKHFRQEKTYLKSNIKSEILINLKDYSDPKKDIEVKDDKIFLAYAYFRLKFLSFDIDIIIDDRAVIDLKDKNVNITEEDIKIQSPENTIIFDCLPTNDVFSEQVKIISALFSGRTPWKNADHFLMKLYNQYLELSTDADFIHFEILASNLLRDKGNPSYPARLNRNYNPTIVPLKSIPKVESWLQALAFENPNESITTGLLYDRPTTETILEKIITGKF